MLIYGDFITTLRVGVSLFTYTILTIAMIVCFVSRNVGYKYARRMTKLVIVLAFLATVSMAISMVTAFFLNSVVEPLVRMIIIVVVFKICVVDLISHLRNLNEESEARENYTSRLSDGQE